MRTASNNWYALAGYNVLRYHGGRHNASPHLHPRIRPVLFDHRAHKDPPSFFLFFFFSSGTKALHKNWSFVMTVRHTTAVLWKSAPRTDSIDVCFGVMRDTHAIAWRFGVSLNTWSFSDSFVPSTPTSNKPNPMHLFFFLPPVPNFYIGKKKCRCFWLFAAKIFATCNLPDNIYYVRCCGKKNQRKTFFFSLVCLA